MKILITLGGTAEALDGVRFITNFSSGATGSFIADELTKSGHKVKALCSKNAKVLPGLCEKLLYSDFKSLDELIRRTLKEENFHLIIHLAAVSDFSPVSITCAGREIRPGEEKKIPSDAEEMTVKLKRNFKIVSRLKDYASNKPAVAAFKLTNGASQEEARKAALKVEGADFVVHNDLSEHTSKERKFTFYKQGFKQKICPLRDLPEQILKSALEILNA